MKLIERSIAVFAAAVSLVSVMMLPASAYEVNGLSVSENALRQGDEFTVTLSVPPTENADTASLNIFYDDSAFEVAEWEPVMSGSYHSAGGGVIALAAANAERYIDLENGLTLTAVMRVKGEAADGIYDFVLKEHTLCFLDEETWEFKDLWFPEITDVTVTVGDPSAAAAAVTTEAVTTAEVITTAVQMTAPIKTEAVKPAGEADGTDPVMIVIIAVLAVVVVGTVILAMVIRTKNGSKDTK